MCLIVLIVGLDINGPYPASIPISTNSLIASDRWIL